MFHNCKVQSLDLKVDKLHYCKIHQPVLKLKGFLTSWRRHGDGQFLCGVMTASSMASHPPCILTSSVTIKTTCPATTVLTHLLPTVTQYLNSGGLHPGCRVGGLCMNILGRLTDMCFQDGCLGVGHFAKWVMLMEWASVLPGCMPGWGVFCRVSTMAQQPGIIQHLLDGKVICPCQLIGAPSRIMPGWGTYCRKDDADRVSVHQDGYLGEGHLVQVMLMEWACFQMHAQLRDILCKWCWCSGCASISSKDSPPHKQGIQEAHRDTQQSMHCIPISQKHTPIICKFAQWNG